MKKTKLTLIVSFMLVLILTEMRAQEAMTTSGSNASGDGGAVSYTLGQVVYTTNTSSTGTITQGVQQPYEIMVISGIEEITGISLECTVFPNPVKDLLKLKFENYPI